MTDYNFECIKDAYTALKTIHMARIERGDYTDLEATAVALGKMAGVIACEEIRINAEIKLEKLQSSVAI